MPTVLVVDDDFMVADIHRRFVEATDGFRAVGVAHSAAETRASVVSVTPPSAFPRGSHRRPEP